MMPKGDFIVLLTALETLENRFVAKLDSTSTIGKEPSINPVLTTFASSTTYDEPACIAGRLFDEKLIFVDGPVFDEEPVFVEEPVFDMEFDAGPIFDDETNDFTTEGCGVVLCDDPDVSTTMAGHNNTASPRQASMTFNIDKDFVLDSGIGVVALTAISVVTSDIDTPANCSTKCLGRAVIASAVATSLSVAGMSRSVPPPAEPEAAQLSLKLRSDMELGMQPSTKCFMKCPGHTTGAVIRASFPDFTPAILLAITLLDVDPQSPQLLNSEALLYASLSTHKVDSGKYTERQPWPPPIELRITVSGAIVRPMPWPSFDVGVIGSATWCFSWSVKPPWPPPSHICAC